MSRGRGAPAILLAMAWLAWPWSASAALIASARGLGDVRGVRLVIVGLRGADSLPLPRPPTIPDWVLTRPEDANLTDFGADQAFELGIALRNRYSTLLKDVVSKDIVGAVTASASRYQRTVENFLEGVHFTEGEEERAGRAKTQQLLLNDTLLDARALGDCAAARDAWEPIASEALPFLAKWRLNEQPFIRYVASAAKVPGTLGSMERLAAGLLDALRRDEALPAWFRRHPGLREKDVIRRLLRFTDASSLACAHSKRCRALMAGGWAQEMWRGMEASVNRRSSRKMLVFGGSDASLHAMMESLGFLANNYLPPVAGFILELRPKVGKSKDFEARLLFHRPRKITQEDAAFRTDIGIAKLSRPCRGAREHWCPGQEAKRMVFGAWDAELSRGCSSAAEEEALVKVPFEESLFAVGGDGERGSEAATPCEDHLKAFRDCGSLCPPACGVPDRRPCLRHCVAACYCVEPFVLADPFDLTSACVLRRRCPLLGKDSLVRVLPHEVPHRSHIKASESLFFHDKKPNDVKLIPTLHLASPKRSRGAGSLEKVVEKTVGESDPSSTPPDDKVESPPHCEDQEKEFLECGSGCPGGCGRLRPVCASPCRRGCFCRPPLVLKDPLDGFSACVEPLDCPPSLPEAVIPPIGFVPPSPLIVPLDPLPDESLFAEPDFYMDDTVFEVPPPPIKPRLPKDFNVKKARPPPKEVRSAPQTTPRPTGKPTSSSTARPTTRPPPTSTTSPRVVQPSSPVSRKASKALLTDGSSGSSEEDDRCSDPDKEWRPCGPECRPACGADESLVECGRGCVPGCFCRAPFVQALADDADSACILPARCPQVSPPSFARRGRCQDEDARCGEWARRGECRRNAYWMNLHCQSACDCCGCSGDDVAERQRTSCVDYSMECPFWALQAECRNNPLFMQLACRHSCRLCQAPPLQPQGSPRKT